MEQYLFELMNSSVDLHFQEIVMRIGFSLLMGLVIYISYKYTHTKTVYSEKFNITLVTLVVLTAMLITVIENNIALSLAMLGALSTIRFRTSIRDSRDSIYIFWAVILGVMAGVGEFMIAVVGSTAVFLMLLIFGRVKSDDRILIIIKGSRFLEQEIRRTIFDYFPKAPILKVQNSTADSIELIYEVNRRLLDQAEAIETRRSLEEERANRTLLDILYGLGEIDYANIIAQSDEIT